MTSLVLIELWRDWVPEKFSEHFHWTVPWVIVLQRAQNLYILTLSTGVKAEVEEGQKEEQKLWDKKPGS
jgi:hypothetical protein